ncbi:sensor histidine kinase [Solicola gregarius]|uniref:histidine kinase n=1 Tax=Solicola gregarius TaxID=2908642 RepID=A0AA46TLD9_9ACTN|nr:sensor histidine kinase [Solicola gregarius]UYM07426.1 sensor histidine kinase [Solicola gregarius]
MGASTHFSRAGIPDTWGMGRELSLPLFWRVCLINGGVIALGVLVLVLSPMTVSARPLWSEGVILSIGLLVSISLNGVLLRSVLGPLDRLTAVMATIDLRYPGRRLEEQGSGPARSLVRGFNAMLERLEVERSVSTARALHAQEAERQRIAQELHDEVGQSLTAVLLGLKRAIDDAPQETVAELDDVRDTTRATLEEVRRISQRLRPGVLADLGLLRSLYSLVGDLAARTGISVDRRFPPSLPELPPETELVIYRVAQEALTNVTRHARADNVDVELNGDVRGLVLRIADDGTGSESAAIGAGIQGMHERAQMVAGSLDVRPRDGGGTEVRLEVPIAGGRT